MRTIMYLLRHAATEANLARPARLQGRGQNPPLAAVGIRQAELTRDFLAVRAIDHCYCSPLLRAVQTAAILAEPHELTPIPQDDLIECDVGLWEGRDWQSIRQTDPERYQQFMKNPAEFGYPEGETFADVYRRVSVVLEELFQRHEGDAILVVGHHVVNRTYLAGLLGLGAGQARHVKLDNCGISVIVREPSETTVTTLNAAFHLQGLAA